MLSRLVPLCGALALLALAVPVPATAQQPATVAGPGQAAVVRPSGPISDQYIVVFKRDVIDPRGRARAMAREHGIRIGGIYRFALRGFSGRMSAAVAERLRLDPDVAYVEQDAHAFAHAQTMPTGIDRIEADLNLGSVAGSPVIAILDTGIDLDHPDLNVVHGETCFWKWGPFFVGECGRGNGDDDFFHGTHVAGSAAAIDDGNGVVGVAAGYPLWAIKVLDQNGSGSLSSVIAGVDYITQHANQVAVANMSLGLGSHQQSLCDAITNSIDAGIVHVASAGNAAASVNNNNSPADCPGVITVSALADFDGQAGGLASPTCRADQDDSLADFSNFGPDIDIMAPGVCIASTTLNGAYAVASGTSMSAPHVAGTVALYISTLGTRDVNGDGLTDGADVAKIKNDLIAAAMPQADPDCGLSTFDDPDGNAEPIVFANAVLVGGTGACGGTVANTPPMVTITAPSSGSAFDEGVAVAFTGTADDLEDGALAGALAWSSDLDGAIGSGATISATLSVGVHTIIASVSDSDGASGSDTITVTVNSTATNAPPAVNITGPADGSTFEEGATITFTGTADDFEDGVLTADLAWVSDLDGTIGVGGSFSTSALSVGVHTITASVTDSDAAAGSDAITVTVDPAGSSGQLSVADVSYCGEGGRSSDKHLVSIVTITDDLGPVSNATVSATITKIGGQPQSGTATTDASGEALFTWKNAGSGDFSTTVDSVDGDTSISTPSNAVTWPNDAFPCP